MGWRDVLPPGRRAVAATPAGERRKAMMNEYFTCAAAVDAGLPYLPVAISRARRFRAYYCRRRRQPPRDYAHASCHLLAACFSAAAPLRLAATADESISRRFHVTSRHHFDGRTEEYLSV